ncbi:MAG: hypothetical protein Q8O31_03785 [Rhodocyclaceae bacterium]|nr:hypothetical protein [Rhodocyclaceae bacterium]
MNAITYTTTCANRTAPVNRGCNDPELDGTDYLLFTPTNEERLLSAATQLNSGKGVDRKLTQ